MSFSFWVESTNLLIADSAQVVWRGQPDGMPVRSVVALPETADAVVLLEPDSAPRNAYGQRTGYPNLVRVTAAGRVVWRAAAVEDKDAWVAVAWRDGGLYGNTWSGYIIELDPHTGRELSREFGK
jgi:hypothetical protein